ncbi:hypothetical protein MPSEU_000601800 [Mayamaea pseudoterrestris]|nr:hypothetical protein MPSEU_000601800 [Mayamaea pseudoterrestris]
MLLKVTPVIQGSYRYSDTCQAPQKCGANLTMGVSRQRGLVTLLRLLWCYIILRSIHGLQPRSTKSSSSPRIKIKKSSWNVFFEQLQAFHRRHGHAVVSKRDDPSLYRWTCQQRSSLRHRAESQLSNVAVRPRMTFYKVQQLSSIDFVWDVQEYRWNQRYEELRAYVNATNNTLVPANHPGALGVWVQNQRRELKRFLRGENSTLTVSRILALKELQFDRDTTTWNDLWHQRYHELLDFVKEHGHTHVPEDYRKNPALGQWVMNQRTHYRRYADGEPSALSEERLELLEKVDFKWRYREDKWHEMKLRLLDYYEQHGHLRINPRDAKNSDLRLWLILQRHYYNRLQQGRESPMTQDRIDALEGEIPNFPWQGRNKRGPSKSDWARMFEAMREKGIDTGTRAKSHWFEGVNPLTSQVKSFWSDEELLALWYSEGEEEE